MYDIALHDLSSFTDDNKNTLNSINHQLTEIMLLADCACSKNRCKKPPWSPEQQHIAHTFLYWKQKMIMSNKKLFHITHLE
jgi:hypothetical protein